MGKILTATIILTLISSCVLNRDHGKDIHTEYMDFNFKESHNEFIYKSKINAIADNDIYYKTNFSIKLPKNLKNWQISSNEFFFEYSGKEIIYINSGYKNKGQAGKWVIRDTNDDEIFNTLNSYWTKRKYSEGNLKVFNSSRVSKVYTDGKALILLYNIKKENFEKYFELIKSFEYIE
ncbi:hypothetical protein SAMN05444377_10827 [Flavobacterium fontis]|uniref:Lipoprotein n=1 Tax=Flavobacterium fontis TaxID=1124188 RepID=A0A1M5BCM9_9FLAO|nr:hypothetical protein [Flavobacterium fontis]SHF40185.1 hypothetical protein SAMN05444377_10827 [Flavobacterium fontis]